MTDLRDGRGVRVRHLKIGLHRHCAVNEEPDGFVLIQRLDACAAAEDWRWERGQRERRDAESGLPRHAEGFPAARQQAQIGTGAQEHIGQLRAGLQQVLAVVEEQQ